MLLENFNLLPSQEAKKSIRYYRHVRGDHDNCKTIQLEIDRLKRLIGETEASKSSFEWSDLLRNPNKKAMIIAAFLPLLCEFGGTISLISYSATIFQESGSFMSPNNSSIIIGVIKLIGTITAPLFVERAGRKARHSKISIVFAGFNVIFLQILYIISTAGSILGFAVLGSYLLVRSLEYSVHGFTWIPIVSFSFLIFIQSLAIGTLYGAVTAEILPENIKSFGISVSNTLLGSSAFMTIKYLPFWTN